MHRVKASKRPIPSVRRLVAGTMRWASVVVTVLAAPLVLLVSAPLELGAALARRGGELSAVARPA